MGVCAHRLGCILRAQHTFAVDLQFESWASPTQSNLVAGLWAIISEDMHHSMYVSALGPEGTAIANKPYKVITSQYLTLTRCNSCTQRKLL